MKSKIHTYTVLSIIITVLLSCTGSTDPPLEVQLDYFPIAVGMKWIYQLVKSDYDTSKAGFTFPVEFTIEIIEKDSINDFEYYAVRNYFFPGPFIDDTSFMRIEDDRVFVIIDNNEYQLYSFNDSDTSRWQLPLYVNPTWLVNFYTTRTFPSSSQAKFVWADDPEVGRSEGPWTEFFNKGIGRTKIISKTMLFGEVIWEGNKIN